MKPTHSWDPPTNEYSECESCILDHQDFTVLPFTLEMGPAFISAIISYSLMYNAVDVMGDDNVATALSAQIQISIALIGSVEKPSVERIVLAMQ